MCAYISQVFNFTAPVRKNEVEQRAFVERIEYENRLRNALLTPGVLVVSGYSGVGKSTAIAQALNAGPSSRVSYKELPVRIFAERLAGHANPLQAIYREIEPQLGANVIPDKDIVHLQEERLAELLHLSRLVVMVENFHVLDTPIARQLHTLFKAWSEWSPSRGSTNRLLSKIVLVSPVPKLIADQWLTDAANAPGVPIQHITLPPWTPEHLLQIVRRGAELLNITYHPAVENGLINLSCGIPRALTALANLTATAANGYGDEVRSRRFQVNPDHLGQVLASYTEFKNALLFEAPALPRDPVNQLVISYLGVNGGEADEQDLVSWFESQHIDLQQQGDLLSRELTPLLTVLDYEDEQSRRWFLNELAFGALTFVKLYLQKVMPKTPPNIGGAIESLLAYHNGHATEPEDIVPADRLAEPAGRAVKRTQVFISYSHQDQKYHDELRKFLALVEDRFDIWSDEDIDAGDEWRPAIEMALARAKVAVLLVSPNFLNSAFIRENELPPLLEAAAKAHCRIVWVAVERSLVDQSAIGRYQAANSPNRPLASLSRPQRAEEIDRIGRLILEQLRS